jgi:hypothetical protein
MHKAAVYAQTSGKGQATKPALVQAITAFSQSWLVFSR